MSEQPSIPHSGGLYSADEEGNNSRTLEGHTTPVSNVHMASVCKKKWSKGLDQLTCISYSNKHRITMEEW